jgi:thiol-disulfide isomerase/thioredoxin
MKRALLFTLSFVPVLLASCSTQTVLKLILETAQRSGERASTEQQGQAATQQDALGSSGEALQATWDELQSLQETLAAGAAIDPKQLEELTARIDRLASEGEARSQIEPGQLEELRDAKITALSIGAEVEPTRYAQLRDEYFSNMFDRAYNKQEAASASVHRYVTRYLSQPQTGRATVAALSRHITSHPDCEMNVELYVATVERLANEGQLRSASGLAKEGLRRCAEHQDVDLIKDRIRQIYREHPAEPGTPMQFTSPTLRQTRFDLKSLRGRPVLVTFWATWCPACIKETPTIKQLYDRYQKEGLEVVGISLDHDREELSSYVAENEISWPQMFSERANTSGEDHPIAKHYGVTSIPAVFLVDEHGMIAAADLRGEREIETAILDLLESRP